MLSFGSMLSADSFFPIWMSFWECLLQSFHRKNNLPWQKSLVKDGLRPNGLLSGLDTGTKLYVSNLDVLVSNDDIRVQHEPCLFNYTLCNSLLVEDLTIVGL